MFLKPMRVLLALATIACAVLLSGCWKSGDSASPPPGGLTAVAGDGQVTLSWQPESGVEYWLFWGPGTTVDVTHASFIRTNVSTPFIVPALTNGVPYSFTINGRRDGGPGGSPAPVVTATPRPTGIEWTIGGPAGTAGLKGVAYGGVFDTVGTAGAFFQSADGITWTPPSGNWAAVAGVINVNAIIDTLSRFIAVGDAGLILYTTDNTTWTAGTFAVPPATAPKLNALSSNGTRVVAVGDGGAIYYSDDSAVTWNAAASVPGGTGNLYGVTNSSSGRWVAAGAAGTLITSTDGSNWVAVTSVTPAIATDLTGIAFLFSTSTFAAVGVGGVVATSSDGLVWTTQVISPNDLQAVAASVSGAIVLVAVGKAGTAFWSVDGTTWVSRTTGTASDLLGVVSGGGQFVAVGQAGTTVYSK